MNKSTEKELSLFFNILTICFQILLDPFPDIPTNSALPHIREAFVVRLLELFCRGYTYYLLSLNMIHWGPKHPADTWLDNTRSVEHCSLAHTIQVLDHSTSKAPMRTRSVQEHQCIPSFFPTIRSSSALDMKRESTSSVSTSNTIRSMIMPPRFTPRALSV